MPNFVSKARALALAAWFVGLAICAQTHAQSTPQNSTCSAVAPQGGLLNEVHTVAAQTQAVPLECSFAVTVAGTYQVTLTDLGVVPGSSPAVPAPLASVKLAVTSGSTIVGTPLLKAGSLQIPATPGTYVIRVVGTPGTQLGSGPVGIQVTNVADNSVLASFSASLALPNTGLPSNEGVVDDSFTVSSDGSYVVALTDLKLPQALTVLELLVTNPDGTFVTNPPLAAAGSTTVSLVHGVNYRIFAVGQSDSTVNAGLFSTTVTPAAGGAAAYSKVVPIGTVTPAGAATLNAGTAYTFSLSDLAFPAALTGVTGVVVANGQVAAQLTASGTSPQFTAVAATYQVFASGSTGASGSYAATLSPVGGSPVLSVARAITAAGSASTAYSFDTPAPIGTAGSYQLNLADFAAPSSFAALSAAAVQNGAVLGTPLTATGNQNINVAAGPVSFLVFAQAATGGGLFGLNLTAAAGGTPVFATTQGVGALFVQRQITFTSAADYALSVSDVGFPAPLASFAVYLTQGTNRVGAVYAGGPLKFSATAGSYFVNYIAQPGGTDKAGTYAIAVVNAPVVTLQSDVNLVGSGGTAHLTWSSQYATSCTASGGWSGSQALSGTTTTSPITSNATFTLTCSGAGVTAAQSVTVNVSAPAPSHGGGGAVGSDLLLMLAAALGFRFCWPRRRAGTGDGGGW